jgi:hypothetical protein
MCFMLFALIAGASSLKSLTSHAGDIFHPMHAAAVAPAEAGIAATGLAASGHAGRKRGDSDPTQVREGYGIDSTPVRIDKPRPILKERPAIAAVPIGYRQDPAALPPEPSPPVVAAQSQDPEPPVAPETASAALPISPASAPALTPTKAPDGGANAPPSATRSRDGAKVVVKRADPDDKPRPGSHSGQQQGQRSARMRASPVDNDVISSREKQLAAHARALGIHVPPALLDLARETID